MDIVNKVSLVHSFSLYVYFFSLHVSGNYVPIIRRNNCIYATLGICYPVWITVWYAGWNETKKKTAVDVVHHEGVCIGKLIVSHLVNKLSTFNIMTIYYHFYKTSLFLIPIVHVHIFLSTICYKPGVEYR